MNLTAIISIAALVASYQPLFAQINNSRGDIVGNGQIVHQTRSIATYNRLQVDFAVKVRITEGDPSQAELEGEQNVLPYLTIGVNQGELSIGLSRTAKFKETKPITVTIHRTSLESIQAQTACTITSTLPLRADRLTVKLREACKLTAPLAVQQLNIDLETASSVAFEGNARNAVFKLDGASQLEAPELRVAKAELSVTGASHAVVEVTETLSASADGVSTITYSGKPNVTSQRASGLSKIKRAD